MPEENPQDQDQPINGEPTTEKGQPSPGPAEDSSAASSTGSKGGSPFVGDPGNTFDPKTAPAGPEFPSVAEAEPDLLVEWEEDQVRRWLLLQGELGHTLAGVGENDWRYTEADLTSIAGPLSRILNRYDTTRAAAAYSDPASVIFGFSMYTIRSVGERRKALAEIRAAQDEEPITGAAAPPGSGPPVDAADLDWNKA